MATRGIITVRQLDADIAFKAMIEELKKKEGAENPYHGRSESEIAKMLLRDKLIEEHKRICNKKRG